VAAEVASNLTARGVQVLAAPGESEHLDFVDRTISYEDQLQVAGKAYLDWYMLSQVRGLGSGSGASGGAPQASKLVTEISQVHAAMSTTARTFWRQHPSHGQGAIQVCMQRQGLLHSPAHL